MLMFIFAMDSCFCHIDLMAIDRFQRFSITILLISYNWEFYFLHLMFWLGNHTSCHYLSIYSQSYLSDPSLVQISAKCISAFHMCPQRNKCA